MSELFLNILTFGGWHLYKIIKLNESIKEQKNKLEFEIKKSQIEFNRKFKIYDKVYLYDENCWKNGEF